MKLTVLSAGLPLILLFSCDHASHEQSHHGSAELPQLDHGNRWIADAPTRAGFAKLRASVPRAIRAEDGWKAYNERAASIESNIQAVFAACKMTGPGHTELHKFMALLLQDLEPMRGRDRAAAAQAQEKLSQHLDLFATYFE